MRPLKADCRSGYEYTGEHYCLILLQFTTYYEDAVAILVCCELLRSTDTLEPLCGPALCEDDINLETVADLSVQENQEGKEGNKEDQNAGWREARQKRTSMWRSVAPVKESMTIARTSDSGRCRGCD